MKKNQITPRSSIVRLLLAGSLAGLHGLGAQTPSLRYSFEDLSDLTIDTTTVNLAPGASVNGMLVNPILMSLVSGETVAVNGVRYALGRSLSFNPGNDELGNLAAPHIDTGILPDDLGFTSGLATSRDYTAMAWVKPANQTGDNMVFGQAGDTSLLHLGMRGGAFHSGHWGDDVAGGTTQPGVWQHVAWVNEGTSQSIYVNGALVAGPGASASVSIQDVNVLIGTFTGTGSFNGQLDEVKVFPDVVLTPEEITTAMSADLPVYEGAVVSLSRLSHDGFRFEVTDSASSTTNPATLVLLVDDVDVTASATVNKEAGVIVVTYEPPAALPLGSLHSYRLTVRDQSNVEILSAGDLRAPYFPLEPLPGPAGGVGFWGVRELRKTDGWGTGLDVAVAYAQTQPATDPDPEDNSLVEAANVPVINHSDGDAVGAPNKGSFNNDFPFLSDTPGDDDNLMVVAKTQLVVPAAGEYTFYARSDDGFGLRISGGPDGYTGRFTTSYGNGVIDTGDPQTLVHPGFTGDSSTRGVYTFSAPGAYDVQFVAFEGGGGAFWELSWAPGNNREERDAYWQLVGNPDDPSVTSIPFVSRFPETLPGPLGTAGHWGIRTYLQAHIDDTPDDGNDELNVNTPDTLAHTLTFLQTTTRAPEDADDLTIDAQRPFLNARDPGNTGISGDIPNDVPFPGFEELGTQDRVITVAKGRIQVTQAGDYTFSARGDDGFLFRIRGVDGPDPHFNRVSHVDSSVANGRYERSTPNVMFFEAGTGDSNTRGVITLAAGLYDLEYVHWEGGGGFFYELAVAGGAHPHGAGTTPVWRPVGYPGGPVTGLGVAEPGWTVESSVAKVFPEGEAPASWLVADGEAAIEETLADDTAPAAKVSTWDAINFHDPQSGGPGSIPGDVPWPLNTPAEDNYFAVRATGQLVIPAEGYYRLGFEGDDGGYLALYGTGGLEDPSFESELVTNATNAAVVDSDSASGAANVLRTDVPTGNSRTIGRVLLSAGVYQVKTMFFEIAGGAYWEVIGGAEPAGDFAVLPLIAKGGGEVVQDITGFALVDPTAAAPADLAVTAFTFDPATGQFSLTFQSQPDKTYALDYSNGLQPADTPASAARWTPAPGFGSVASGGATTTITGQVSAFVAPAGLLPDGSVSFFRVREL